MSYLSEFPDYDGKFYLPKGWYDNSWHNDTCPHAEKRYEYYDEKELSFIIWQDYVDINKREIENGCRYIFVVVMDGDDIFYHETDDIRIIKKFVEAVNMSMNNRGFKVILGDDDYE